MISSLTLIIKNNQMNLTQINLTDNLEQNMAIRIYLIRHGQTDWNLKSRLQGQFDIPLNQCGCWQAEQLSKYLRAIGFDRAFSSSLIRAKTTAESILGDRHLELELLPALQEVCHGDWEGRLESELRLLYPHEFHLWETKPLTCRKPKGESLHQLQTRVIPAWENLVQQCVGDRYRTVLVVSHKFVIQVILCHICGLDLQHFWNFSQDNCAINIIDYQSDGVAQLQMTNLNVWESHPLAA